MSLYMAYNSSWADSKLLPRTGSRRSKFQVPEHRSSRKSPFSRMETHNVNSGRGTERPRYRRSSHLKCLTEGPASQPIQHVQQRPHHPHEEGPHRQPSPPSTKRGRIPSSVVCEGAEVSAVIVAFPGKHVAATPEPPKSCLSAALW